MHACSYLTKNYWIVQCTVCGTCESCQCGWVVISLDSLSPRVDSALHTHSTHPHTHSTHPHTLTHSPPHTHQPLTLPHTHTHTHTPLTHPPRTVPPLDAPSHVDWILYRHCQMSKGHKLSRCISPCNCTKQNSIQTTQYVNMRVSEVSACARTLKIAVP